MSDSRFFMVHVRCGRGGGQQFRATVRALEQEQSCTFVRTDALAAFFAGVAVLDAPRPPAVAPAVGAVPQGQRT